MLETSSGVCTCTAYMNTMQSTNLPLLFFGKSGQWEEDPAASLTGAAGGRFNFGDATVGGTLVVAGGFTGDNGYQNDIVRLSPSSASRTLSSVLPSGIGLSCNIAVGVNPTSTSTYLCQNLHL